MAANISFNIKVILVNENTLPELKGRMEDLSPAFAAIYPEWADLNKQNFAIAAGKEASGANIFGEEWAALTPEYMKEKHSDGTTRVTRKIKKGGAFNIRKGIGAPDWIMVRSGGLRSALIDPEAMFHEFDKQMATFGTPNDPDIADIVAWQMGKRQKERYTIFLSDPDTNAIKRILKDYFSMGGDFADIRFAQGMAALNRESDIEDMDAGFGD